MSPGAAFCRSCGRQATQPPAPQPQYMPQPQYPAQTPYMPQPQPRIPVRAGVQVSGPGLPILIVVGILAVGIWAATTLLPNLKPGGPGGAGATASPTAGGAAVHLGPQSPTPQDLALGTPGPDPTPLTPPEDGPIPADEQTPVLTGALALGQASGSASESIGTNGGTVALGALSISFAASALPADTKVAVTSTEITGLGGSGDYGGAIEPLTPLFTVELGNAEQAAPAVVTLAMPLPAGLPDGAVRMAFYYDRTTGALSPLTPVSADANGITVLAAHFSDLFGAVAHMEKVPATADSGFRPGRDDWEFPNHGSLIAPGGQCEGMSTSAIWYYVYQRKQGGASQVNGLYDNNGATDKTPTLWQDDSDAYRFTAAVHTAGFVDDAKYLGYRDAQWDTADRTFTYDAFRAAIAFSGEPQMIRISQVQGDGNHTMVVYRVSGNRLYIADPNYPSKLRTMTYNPQTKLLGSYTSGNSTVSIAANGPSIYDRTAFVPWRLSKLPEWMATRWADFEKGTAGDAQFPGYDLLVKTQDASGAETWVPLTDGYTTSAATLDIQVTKLTDNSASRMRVYSGLTTKVVGNWAWAQTLKLEPGDNAFGLLIHGNKGTSWEYVDFQRIGITRGGAALKLGKTDPLCAVVGTDMTFEASATGLPGAVKKIRFEWDFGSGPVAGGTFSAPFAETTTGTVTQSFADSRDHQYTVTLLDVTGATPVVIGQASGIAREYIDGGVDYVLCKHDPGAEP